MVVCEDYSIGGPRHSRIDAYGLMANIKRMDLAVPGVRREQVCVLVAFTGGRGRNVLYLQCCLEETEEVIFQTQHREVEFGNDPLELEGVVFTVRDCRFPRPGRYLLRVMCQDLALSEYAILVQ
jgi:hypothetical protein